MCRKLLTRNLFATPEQSRHREGRPVYSRADILNLISTDSRAIGQLGWTFVGLAYSLIELLLGCSYVWYLLGPSGFIGLSTLLFTFPPAYLLTKLQYRVYEERLSINDEKISLMQEAIQAISMIKMMAAERFWYQRINEVRDREFTRMIQARIIGFLSALL